MNRDEHLKFCKARALEYVDRGELSDAAASMLSDMEKHPETKGIAPILFAVVLPAVLGGDRRAVREWIEGFR